ARTDGIGGIDHDHVETLIGLGHEFGAVSDDDPGARVVIGAGRHLREMLAAEIDDAAIDLAQRRLLYLGMLQHLPQHGAVAAADDQRLFRLAVSEQRHVAHHLVIDELVLGGELDDAVEHHHPTKVGVLEDDQSLMLGLAVEKDVVRLQTDTEATVERLFDPAFHRFISLPRICSLTTTLRGEKASFKTSMAALGLVWPQMKLASEA